MTERTIGMSKVCIMQGCHNKAVHSRKLLVLEQVDDYDIPIKLCSRHKSHFKKKEALVSINFKAYCNEALLGESKDKDRQRINNDTLAHMRKQAKATKREHSVQIMIDAAKHFAKVGDGKFLFGFYFGGLFAIPSFRDLLGTDATRQRRAEQIRNQMSLREPYAEREHPDTGNEMVEVCRCGHERIMHDFGEPRGACFTCQCPRYEFDQKLTRAEASDLRTLIYHPASGKTQML